MSTIEVYESGKAAIVLDDESYVEAHLVEDGLRLVIGCEGDSVDVTVPADLAVDLFAWATARGCRE